MARCKSFCEESTLGKVTELFRRQGYHATSMDDILQHAGLSRSSLYDTYGDKHSLFIKTLQSYTAKAAEDWDAALAAQGVRLGIGQLFEHTIEGFGCGSGGGCFAVNAAVEWGNGDEEVTRMLSAHRDRLLKSLSRRIGEDQKLARLSTGTNPRELALFVYNNLTGLQVGMRTGMKRSEAQAIRTQVMQCLG